MKLAAILCQAFDDCYNLESVFKLINIVGSVLDRPKIKEEFTNKYTDILQMLDEEISTCEQIYERQMVFKRANGYLFADRSFPPVTATLRWIQQLGDRITAPIKHFQALQHAIVESEPAQRLFERYEKLMKALELFEETVFVEWTEKVPAQIELNLKKSLISRNSADNFLMLNFHPELYAVLREVHYMNLMEKKGIPEVGSQFAETNELFRNFNLNLDKTINWYNRVGYGILLKVISVF